MGALSVGIAQAALEEGIKYAKERETFGKLIKEHQAIQWLVADAADRWRWARITKIGIAAKLAVTPRQWTQPSAIRSARLYSGSAIVSVTRQVEDQGCYHCGSTSLMPLWRSLGRPIEGRTLRCDLYSRLCPLGVNMSRKCQASRAAALERIAAVNRWVRDRLECAMNSHSAISKNTANLQIAMPVEEPSTASQAADQIFLMNDT